jgi:hypothetical protein
MAKTIKVDLPDPVETHSGIVSVAEFREPASRDFFTLGEPLQIVDQGGGGGFLVEKDEVILAYMERCVQQPFDPIVLGSMSLANAMVCRERFLSFFAQARAKMLSTLATSSSST